jgi:hypothetical protein
MSSTSPTYLYHGTTTRRLRAILRHGLVPRGTRKSLWDAHPSRPDHVYLTTAYGIYYAKCAASTKTDHAALIRIDVDKLDPGRLYADEDALEQANRKDDTARWPTLAERTAFYRDTWDIHPVARNWQGSLTVLGNCSHHGPIPVDAISGIAIVERNSLLWHLCDPTITTANFHLLDGYYRALSAFPFDGPAAAEAEDCLVSSYLDTLKRVPAGTGCRAYERPLPVRQIIVAAERKAA